jgi:GNAT superfamily N-acetyltransferase
MMNQTQVAQLIKENYRALYLTAGRAANCPMVQSDQFSWVNNQHIWPNRIYGLNLKEDLAEDVLREMVQGMASGELPEIITTSMFTQPKNYETIFARVGLEKKFEAAGMALDLTQITWTATKSSESTTSFTTKIVETEEEINAWCSVVMEALFEQPIHRMEAYRNVIAQLIWRQEIRCFMAKQGDEVVATSMMYQSASDIVGIYHVSTLKAYRGQGIGKEITRIPLMYAKELGCRIAVLFASKSGESIYRQLGFESYCTFGRYGLAKQKNE